MSCKEIVSGLIPSRAELFELSKIFAASLRPGAVVGLRGPLGAGKTEFVRAILSDWGVTDQVVSPSYVLHVIYDVAANSYLETATTVNHWDLYRLQQTQAIPEDLQECMVDDTAICFIEWPEKVVGLRDLLTVEMLLDFPDSSVEQFRNTRPESNEIAETRVFQCSENSGSTLSEKLRERTMNNER